MTGMALLGLGVAAVAVLLVLVIWVRMPAFVALLLVAVLTAAASGIPLTDAVQSVTKGVGGTLGNVAIVVGLGAMLGKIIEESGGAESIARYFTGKLGPKKVAAAVTIAAFILGIPVFFDVGFIILAPIIFGFASVARLNPLKIGLPVAATMLTVHVVVPPHPGPVAVAELLNEDVGLLLTVSLPIAAVTALIGFIIAKRFNLDHVVRGESPAETDEARVFPNPPSPWLVMSLILLPFLIIMVGTTGTMVTAEGTALHTFVKFFGAAPIALLIAVIVAWITGIMGLTRVSNQLADAENAGRVEILYTLPVPRWEVTLARWAACVTSLGIMCAATWATVGIGVTLAEMDVAQHRVAAACVGLFLLGLVHAGFACLVYGATAPKGLVTGVPLVVLVVGYIVYSVLPIVDKLSGAQRFSPWYWALGEDPLTAALNVDGCLPLLALTAANLVVGSKLLARRDITQA